MIAKLIIIIITLITFYDFWVIKKKRIILFCWGSYMASFAIMSYKYAQMGDGYYNKLDVYYWLIISLACLNLFLVFSKWTRDGKFSSKCYLNLMFSVLSVILGFVLYYSALPPV